VSACAAFAVVAAAAFACSNLATISLSSGSGRPGDMITLVGTSFLVPRASAGTSPTPVVIHWGASDGPVLATATPDRTGTISATFNVPDGAPGNVIIVATQRRTITSPDNPSVTITLDEAGTPARTTFRILAPGEATPTSTPIDDFAGATAAGQEGSTAMIVMMVLFGTVALSLFAGGVIAFIHQVRTRRTFPQSWGYSPTRDNHENL
jgi:hypothetical protein